MTTQKSQSKKPTLEELVFTALSQLQMLNYEKRFNPRAHAGRDHRYF